MTENSDAELRHHEIRELLGAYLLGGLSESDRARVDRHLADCDSCLDEADAHAPTMDLLRRQVPHRAAEPLDVGPRGVEQLEEPQAPVRAERARPRRGTVLAAAAAAVVILLTGMGLGTALHTGTESGGGDMSIAFSPAPGAAMRGEATFTRAPWGTTVSIAVQAMPSNGPFSLRANGVRGRVEQAATWGPTDDETTHVTGAIAMPIPMVDSVTVLDGHGNPVGTAMLRK